jgi:hypothetical protein
VMTRDGHLMAQGTAAPVIAGGTGGFVTLHSRSGGLG